MIAMGSVACAVLVAAAASPLPEGGGAPGKAYREYEHALIARDWQALHRLTTPLLFQNLSSVLLSDVPRVAPANMELILSGTSEGGTATLGVRREDTRTGNSKESSVPMLLQAGQWRVSTGEIERDLAPVLPFQPAETVRRMNEVYGILEGVRSMSEHQRVPKDVAGLAALLRGRDGTDVPLSDAWGTPFAYRVHPTQQGFMLISFGADGKPDADIYDASGVSRSLDQTATTDPNADIVVGSGRLYFLRYPQGTAAATVQPNGPYHRNGR
jgi:Type II secretion system (T2SS), protein G